MPGPGTFGMGANPFGGTNEETKKKAERHAFHVRRRSCFFSFCGLRAFCKIWLAHFGSVPGVIVFVFRIFTVGIRTANQNKKMKPLFLLVFNDGGRLHARRLLYWPPFFSNEVENEKKREQKNRSVGFPARFFVTTYKLTSVVEPPYPSIAEANS